MPDSPSTTCAHPSSGASPTADSDPAVGTSFHIYGVSIHTSSFVPEDRVVQMNGDIWFHSRLSARGRMRRRHGRPRNHPRRLKVRFVRYQPALDRLLEAAGTPSITRQEQPR